MASLQVDRASPVEDVMTETEATSKEAKTVLPAPPPPPENVKPVDVEEDDEDLNELTAPPFQDKVGYSDDEDDDAEYLSYTAREEAAPPLKYGEGPATFDDLSDDDDHPEDEDHV